MKVRSFIKQHYDKAKQRGYIALFAAQAKANGYDTSFLMGLASRETNMSNILGDQRFNERLGKVVWNGYGIMQVDINTDQVWCLSGKWKDVGEAIAHGVKILNGKRDDLNGRWEGDRTLHDFLWVLAASYNHGAKGSYTDFKTGGSPDPHTTDHNYGEDVLGRAAEFEFLLKADGFVQDDVTTHPVALHAEQPAPVVVPDAPADVPPPAAPINIAGSDNQIDTGVTAPPVAGGGANDPKIPIAPVMTNKDGSKKSWLGTLVAAIMAAIIWLVANIETAFNAAKSSFADSPVATLSIICFFTAILVIYWKYQDRQTQLDKQRENNAHEQNLANQQTLADPKKLNVVVNS